MTEPTTIVLVPGLNCSSRIFTDQIPALWCFGPVMVADHRPGSTIEAIARSILASAPPRFSLVGFSLGGYIALEIVRQARGRIQKLAFLDTSARADTTSQSEHRNRRIATAEAGQFRESLDLQYEIVVHPGRHNDEALRQQYITMAEEYGSEAFVRHLIATTQRPDSRELLPLIQCTTLVLVGDSDQLTPPSVAEEIAAGIKGARLIVVPECGHLSPLERPDTVTQALVDWMSAASDDHDSCAQEARRRSRGSRQIAGSEQ